MFKSRGVRCALLIVRSGGKSTLSWKVAHREQHSSTLCCCSVRAPWPQSYTLAVGNQAKTLRYRLHSLNPSQLTADWVDLERWASDSKKRDKSYAVKTSKCEWVYCACARASCICLCAEGLIACMHGACSCTLRALLPAAHAHAQPRHPLSHCK